MLRAHTQARGTWHLIAPLNSKATLVSFSDGAQWALLPSVFMTGFPGGSKVKDPPASVGDAGLIPGWGRSLEKEMAPHSSTLAWRIPWTEGPGGLQSTGSQRAGHGLATKQQCS